MAFVEFQVDLGAEFLERPVEGHNKMMRKMRHSEETGKKPKIHDLGISNQFSVDYPHFQQPSPIFPGI